MSWSIVVHGGAGNITDALEPLHREGCRSAVESVVADLEAGADAETIACRAVNVLEDDPAFNAGRGAALDEHALPVLDAALMRGHDRAYGAVASVLGVANPIDLARAVLEDGRHCLLVGAGALAFARDRGLPIVDPATLITASARAEWDERAARLAAGEDIPATADWVPVYEPSPGGTVGACVRDVRGHLAAATSTGGVLFRRTGRVGDSPIAGAGTYAEDGLGAMSATGHGETMLRTVFAYRALLALGREGTEAMLLGELEAARALTDGTGGAIAVLADGRVVHARNTRGMGVAWCASGGSVQTGF